MDRYTSPELERLFAVHQSRLVSLLTVAAGSRAAAEDAVQEAFAQALLHWDRVRSYDDPLAWLRRVATNRILNQKRSARRRDAAVERVQGRRAVLAPESVAVNADVVAAIAALPLRQRTAVVLFYLADLPSAEVAATMGITDGAVRYHLSAARAALSALLGVT
jgi:RNA polymerase sigma-70 factor (ECF subfamily)